MAGEAAQHFGWAGPDVARAEWDVMGKLFPEFQIVGQFTRPARAVLWDVMQRITGQHLPNIAQLIGDCVGWGVRNAVDHTAVCEIAAGDPERYRPSFVPYFYGISRVQIGGGRLGANNDGSTGVWGAEAVKRYGTLPADEAGVPAYASQIAKQWGAQGPPTKFIEIARRHTIKTAARLRTIVAVADALANGYGVSIASSKGYANRLQESQGKSWFTGNAQWMHQMAILGYDTVGGELCFFRHNSWGPGAHGRQLDGPAGGGWIRGGDLERELRSSGVECFAYSGFNGFPAQPIDWDRFTI